MTDEETIAIAHEEDVWRPSTFKAMAEGVMIDVEGWTYCGGDAGLYDVVRHLAILSTKGVPKDENEQYRYALISLVHGFAFGAFRSHACAAAAAEIFLPFLEACEQDGRSTDKVNKTQTAILTDFGGVGARVRGEVSPYLHLIEEEDQPKPL